MPVPATDDPILYDSLTDWLYNASQNRLYQACSAFGLTPTQFFALSAIEQLGEPKMSALAAHLGLTPGGATTLLDRLVGHGQVERLPAAHDRRCVVVRLSEAGRTALQAVRERRQEAARQTFFTMSPADRDHLLKGMKALKDVWQSQETP
jgi:DNA-binding MarR family transcriptional regulator